MPRTFGAVCGAVVLQVIGNTMPTRYQSGLNSNEVGM